MFKRKLLVYYIVNYFIGGGDTSRGRVKKEVVEDENQSKQ